MKGWIYQELLHFLSIVRDSLIRAVFKSNHGALGRNPGMIFIHPYIQISGLRIPELFFFYLEKHNELLNN